MSYKIHTILVASEETSNGEYIRLSLSDSDVLAPVLMFEGDKETIKEKINNALDKIFRAQGD